MRNISNLQVKVEDYIIPQVMQPRYIEFIIQNNERIKRDINHNSILMVEIDETLRSFMWHKSTDQIEGKLFFEHW